MPASSPSRASFAESTFSSSSWPFAAAFELFVPFAGFLPFSTFSLAT
jgi:hypothetical protein